MSNEHPERDFELPESLLRKFSDFETRLRRVETIVTISGALFGVLLTLGLLFLSDRLWDTPGWLRVLFTLSGGLGFGYFAWKWLNHWYFKRRGARDMARLVQRHHRGMGDRLLGVVELADGNDLPENVSPALCRAAIAQVARESEAYDFTQAVAARKSRNFALACTGLFLVVLIPFLIFPQAGLNALVRWMAPMGNVERYTFVDLEDLPAEWVVAYGEDFEIPCAISHRSKRVPGTGSCKFKNQPRIESPIEGGKTVFRIPGQTVEGVLAIRVGDVVREMRIVPTHRPELISVAARISLPEYLQRPVETNSIEHASLEVLEGSAVEIVGMATRSLSALEMAGDPSIQWSVNEARFESSRFLVEDESELTLTWNDADNLSGIAPYHLVVSTSRDRAPGIECRGAARAMAVLEDEIVTLTVSSSDDYGIKEMYVNWHSVGNRDKGLLDVGGSSTLAEGSPTAVQLEAQYKFSPMNEHIPENTMVSLVACVVDYKPGREPTESTTFQIYVLNRAQHAKLIQDQIEALQARIEDLARDEEALLEANENMRAENSTDEQDPQSAKELKDKQLAETRNKEQLKQLARESDELIKEAIRNRNIPESTIREWAEMSEKMKSLAQNEMSKAAAALGKASQSPEQREQQLDEAIAMEREVVEQLEKMEKDVNESIENMLAQNFINRLMQVSESEGTIAAGLRILLPQIIGMDADDLPDDDAEQLDLLTSRQLISRKDAGYIQEDLIGFFSRTREEVYKTISDEMIALSTLEELEKLADDIANNAGGQAIRQAGVWKEQFAKWAEYLKEQTGGGGGGGGAPPDAEELNLELLIGLLRARQSEESFREQTRMLEESKQDNGYYTKDAKMLGAKQYDLSNDMARLKRMAAKPEVKALIDKTSGEMMNAGVLLRKPNTGAETVAIETEIIELLSGAVEESSSSSSSAAAMLMAMMGMNPGAMPGAGQGQGEGGNPGGGDTADTPDPASGAADGLADEGRNVDRASGMDPADFPEEFRDALEGFYNALEDVN